MSGSPVTPRSLSHLFPSREVKDTRFTSCPHRYCSLETLPQNRLEPFFPLLFMSPVSLLTHGHPTVPWHARLLDTSSSLRVPLTSVVWSGVPRLSGVLLRQFLLPLVYFLGLFTQSFLPKPTGKLFFWTPRPSGVPTKNYGKHLRHVHLIKNLNLLVCSFLLFYR